jgi:DNA-binding transcriptional MocR family regulator
MMQALYEAISDDERALEYAFKYEVLAQQAEASDDQALIEFFRKMRDEYRRRAERAEQLLARRLPERKVLRK